MTSTAIVTGAASGIGLSLSRALRQHGHHVVMTDVDEERLDAEVARSGGNGVEGHTLDVRDADAVRDLVQRVARERGRLDMIFNNAGIGAGGETDQLIPAHWDRVIDINLKGVVNGVSAAYPIMVDQGFGHIINTASLAGLLPTPFLAPYVMTKHAVVGLSLSLRGEAVAKGVRVTAVCPGTIDTPFFERGAPADLPRSRLRDANDAKNTANKQHFAAKFFKLYPPDRLAEDILKGVRQNKALIVMPTSARVQWWARRLAPGVTDRVTTALAASVWKSLPELHS
jgi:NAD(P)-dependent dehydrogenase (short-subunit alcohol dehydrogenase family)